MSDGRVGGTEGRGRYQDLDHMVDAGTPPTPHPFQSQAGMPFTQRDAVLSRQAVRRGWNVPEAVREKLPGILLSAAAGLRRDPVTGQPIKVTERAMVAAWQGLQRMIEHNDSLSAADLGADVLEGSVEADYSRLSVEELRILDRAFERSEAGHEVELVENGEAPGNVAAREVGHADQVADGQSGVAPGTSEGSR